MCYASIKRDTYARCKPENGTTHTMQRSNAGGTCRKVPTGSRRFYEETFTRSIVSIVDGIDASSSCSRGRCLLSPFPSLALRICDHASYSLRARFDKTVGLPVETEHKIAPNHWAPVWQVNSCISTLRPHATTSTSRGELK